MQGIYLNILHYLGISEEWEGTLDCKLIYTGPKSFIFLSFALMNLMNLVWDIQTNSVQTFLPTVMIPIKKTRVILLTIMAKYTNLSS